MILKFCSFFIFYFLFILCGGSYGTKIYGSASKKYRHYPESGLQNDMYHASILLCMYVMEESFKTTVRKLLRPGRAGRPTVNAVTLLTVPTC